MKLDRDGVPLVGADAEPVFAEGESLLIVLLDHLRELRAADPATVRRAGREQPLDLHPACFIQLDADELRLVAQN